MNRRLSLDLAVQAPSWALSFLPDRLGKATSLAGQRPGFITGP